LAGAGEPCEPKGREVAGVRFVRVCAAPPAARFWISATPLPCASSGSETAACTRVTTLVVARAGDGATLDVQLATAKQAQRSCSERFRGQLPTSQQRAQARAVLGLSALLVREAPGPHARVQLDELPEWVGEGDCAATRAGCARFPAPLARPHRADQAVLVCLATPAMPQARAVPIGSECYERPSEDVRSPDCAVAVPDSAARFELFCNLEPQPPRALPPPEVEAFRCVLPESD
jgi:hypothetical protein